MKTWHRHRCLNKLKVTCHYWVLSKTKLFYGWITLLFFILLKKKSGNFLCYLCYGVLNIGDRSWRVPSSVRIFFLKLDSAHKWINCCNKSISVCVFTAGIVFIIYLNCSVFFSCTLHAFISTIVSCHVIMTNQIWNPNKLLNAAICSNPSLVVPGDPEVVIFVLMQKNGENQAWLAIYFSCHRQITSKDYVTSNHTYSTFTQVSHYLVTKSWLISVYGMIDVATM